MIKILRYFLTCVVIRNFLIIRNESATESFKEEDDCASDIGADNDLRRPVNDGTDECERCRKFTNFMLEHFKV